MNLESAAFLAMEYYLGIWNRSFEITVTPGAICGAFVRGAITSTSASVFAARRSNDATQLVDPERLAQARSHEPGSPRYLALHRYNFSIARSAVAGVRFNPDPKWGMGPVPHSGRLHLGLLGGKTREFILLGQQNGTDLVSKLQTLGYWLPAA